jgi:Spy/CpxP family protein refolding chaperone
MAEKFFDPIDAKKDKKKSKTQKQLKKEEFKKEHNRLIAERNRLFNLEKQATKKCEQDIKNKRKDLKRQLVEKKIDKSAYRKEFNNFKFARYEQLQVEIAKIYDKSDKDLPKPFSFKFKR